MLLSSIASFGGPKGSLDRKGVAGAVHARVMLKIVAMGAARQVGQMAEVSAFVSVGHGENSNGGPRWSGLSRGHHSSVLCC